MDQPAEILQVSGALMRLETVMAVTGLRKTAIYQRISDGKFPQPVRLSARCVRWKSDDVRAWVGAL
jgi:prophage regulatory protein